MGTLQPDGHLIKDIKLWTRYGEAMCKIPGKGGTPIDPVLSR